VEFMVGNLLYRITEYRIAETVVMAMCIAPRNCIQYKKIEAFTDLNNVKQLIIARNGMQ